jgi:uncharacterized protein YkwD
MTLTRSLKLAAPAAAAAFALAMPAGASASSVCGATTSNPAVASIASANQATLCLINQVRRKHHLRPLKLSKKLSKAARRHSRSMVKHRFFQHGNYMHRIRKSGYLSHARSWSTGENIAWGSGFYATPRAIFTLWMHSPGHRANILRRGFREIGIGIHRGAPVRGQHVAATYTTDFGSRRR